MKITPTPVNATLLHTPSPASARRGTAGAAAAAGSGSLSAYASDQPALGASLVGLTARALAQPDMRGDVVAHFQGQIAAGAYQPDPAQIASRMLADPLTDL